MVLAYQKLTADQVADELSHVPQWSIVDGELTRLFEFHNYLEGPLFALKVGHIAEDLNHHPEMAIGYRKVRVSVHTHDVGGLSPYDFELARRIDTIANN